jgi:hypothetical protein
MAHYFDDMFARHIGQPKTKKPSQLRRASTTRSIGARSDFDTSVNGDEDSHDLERIRSRQGSVITETPERMREREEADVAQAQYVSEQLQRVRSHQSADDYVNGDEFEAQLDENGM